MSFKRGDTAIHSFIIPQDIYEKGGTLHFMAKAIPDNDFEDAKAEISKTFELTNAKKVDDKAILQLKFNPSDTQNVNFEGDETSKELNGEFELRLDDGSVYSLPSGNKYIKVTIYADIRRGGR